MIDDPLGESDTKGLFDGVTTDLTPSERVALVYEDTWGNYRLRSTVTGRFLPTTYQPTTASSTMDRRSGLR